MCNSLDNGLTFAFSHFYQLSGWDVYILSVHHNKNAGVCLTNPTGSVIRTCWTFSWPMPSVATVGKEAKRQW